MTGVQTCALPIYVEKSVPRPEPVAQIQPCCHRQLVRRRLLEYQLLAALAALGPQWVAYGMSFLTLGIFWAGQQTQLNHLKEGTRDLTWIHLGFLFAITLLPLSTRLLAEFITYRGALLIYWLNILAPGVMLYWSWKHATHAGLIKADTPEEVRASICKRVVVAQSLYAGGAALCAINTWVSIGAIVLVQLNYAIAPRWWRGKRK